MTTKQPIKLGWQHWPALVNDGIEAAPPKSRAHNEHTGQIVGEIVHYANRSEYTSCMPKSFGEKHAFINREKAIEWVNARYAEPSDAKPKAPELPK